MRETSENDGSRIATYRRATKDNPRGPWCAYFVSWVMDKAGVPIMPGGVGSGRVRVIGEWAQRTGRFKSSNPKPGDIVFLRGRDHIGLVEKVDKNGTVHTIEGNADNMVKRRTYARGNPQLSGYVNAE